jgi:hypothetical protein
MKVVAFYISPCNLVEADLHLKGTFCLHHQSYDSALSIIDVTVIIIATRLAMHNPYYQLAVSFLCAEKTACFYLSVSHCPSYRWWSQKIRDRPYGTSLLGLL